MAARDAAARAFGQANLVNFPTEDESASGIPGTAPPPTASAGSKRRREDESCLGAGGGEESRSTSDDGDDDDDGDADYDDKDDDYEEEIDGEGAGDDASTSSDEDSEGGKELARAIQFAAATAAEPPRSGSALLFSGVSFTKKKGGCAPPSADLR